MVCPQLCATSYSAAGIDLYEIAQDNNFDCPSNLYQCPSWTPALHSLGQKVGIEVNGEKGVRISRASRPLVGDIIFFDHTYDRKSEPGNIECKIGDNKLTHVGIVINVGFSGNSDTILFAHAGSKARLSEMNLKDPENSDLNSALRVIDPYPDCKDSDVDDISRRAGALFSGYTTIR